MRVSTLAITVMRRPSCSRVCAVAIQLVVGSAAASAQLVPGAPATDWERNRQEFTLNALRDYNAFIAEWSTTLSGGDEQRVAERYDDGALLLMGGKELVQGRAAIRAFMGRVLPGLVEIRMGLIDFVASDRLAYAAGPLFYQFRDERTGAVQSVNGNHVTVLVRDGRRWKIRSQVLRYETSGTANEVKPATSG